MYLEEKTAKHASLGVSIMRTRERHLIFDILTRQGFLPDRTADGYLLFIFSVACLFSRVTFGDFRRLLRRFRRSVSNYTSSAQPEIKTVGNKLATTLFYRSDFFWSPSQQLGQELRNAPRPARLLLGLLHWKNVRRTKMEIFTHSP